MTTTKKEKNHANSRARRNSVIVISHSKKSKKRKDTDTESVSTDSSDIVAVPKCPFRFMLVGMMETEASEGGKKNGGCPLRRVQLWHVIPLCLLAIVNLLLVIVALLGLAGYRIALGVQSLIISFAKPGADRNPYEGLVEVDEEAIVVLEKA